MGVLSKEDNEKIKRAIPKGSNKIIDATVAKLYIAFPDPENYKDTGLSGAVVLVDDLVGKTFFIKLIDIQGQRGILWDQELPVNFQYNKDRTFFHSFELEEFNCGLLFEDVSEANHFFKRVTSKEKYGSKHTVANKNAVVANNKAIIDEQNKPDAAGPRGFASIDTSDPNNIQKVRRAKNILYYSDAPPPEWRDVYSKLEAEEGISEWMVVDNREFIKQYIRNNGPQSLVGLEPPIPRKYQYSQPASKNRANSQSTTDSSHESSPVPSGKKKKAPPPPPPPAGTEESQTPPETPGSTHVANEHKYRLPPAPTFMGQGLAHQHTPSPPLPPKTPIYGTVQKLQQEQQQQPSHPSLPPRTPIPANNYSPQFGVPSQTAGGSGLANFRTGTSTAPSLPPAPVRSVPPALRTLPPAPVAAPRTLPQAPQAPPRTPQAPPALPPAHSGVQHTAPGIINPPLPPMRSNYAPPPPPSRRAGGAPPPPPSRKPVGAASQQFSQPMAPPVAVIPPQLPPMPPKSFANNPPVAPPMPPSFGAPQAPPMPPAMHQQNRYTMAMSLPGQSASISPPPPPAPPAQAPPIGGGSPSAGGPGNADALFAAIRGSGIGQLKKVDKSQIKHF
ncbi:actin-binding protein [Saccharomycopsis crataegensis]|uniref:Actin-binding protein n=1 Tax=Saccharomycopsis crataegensis TaxID=43959 RepID=A0AAV5QQ54_9ASCO|nr:actin-binding protein [Saccharomycopsis crataegensis]